MRKPIRATLKLASITVFLFFLIQDLHAQNGDGSTERHERGGRGRSRGEMSIEPSRIIDIEEGNKWLEDARKYREEIDELDKQLEPLNEEVRRLYMEAAEAESDDKIEKIREKLKEVLKKRGDIEIEMAEKKLEFSEKNFKIALDRLVRSQVEYEETRRRIEWRGQVIDRRFHRRGPRGGSTREDREPVKEKSEEK